MVQYSLFATCPRGLEAVLAGELSQCGCRDIRVSDGGVSFRGGWEQVYRANLHSRTAGRVLLQVAQGRYRNEQDIYRLARQVKWPHWFTVAQTFKIKAEGKRARVKSLDFCALKIKDAVCDVFREVSGSRPSVDRHRPDVRIRAFLREDELTLFVDTSGEALFKRGYRLDTGDAPLRENLAAGLLLLSGYDGSQPFQDPFCGSGTIALEAAWIALNRPAGLLRRFAFEHLSGFDKALWVKIKAEGRAQIRQTAAQPIAASDHSAQLVEIARENARAAEVEEFIRFDCCDVREARPCGDNGMMVANPPYGVRLEEVQTLHRLYPQLGSWLKNHYAGWQIALLSGDLEMPKLMRLKPKRKMPLFNGKLDCRLFVLDMVQGSNR